MTVAGHLLAPNVGIRPLPVTRGLSTEARARLRFLAANAKETPVPDNPRWTRRPEGSTWGDFGPDDELGRLNLATREKVLQGIAEVKLGKTFCLSLPLDYPGGNIINPRRTPPELRPTMRNGKPNMT